ncbi:MAG: TolC family protein [Verrucomicrobia bacterium]|nr:TolC family protein [Kiritimatiellia bacterium]MCP5488626.1 TolC family protein [Verrucomicrobiota bacterium]
MNQLYRLTALVVGLVTASHAETVPTLNTFSNALTYAALHHPSIHAAASDLEAARMRIPQARSLPDPMLQVTRFVESVQTRTGPQDMVLTLSQRMLWWGTLSTRKDAATADADAAEYALQARLLQMMRELGKAFYEVAYLGKAIDLTSENLNLLRELEPVAEAKVEGGGDLNALLRLKVEVGKLESLLATQEQRMLAQRSVLNSLMGRPVDEARAMQEWEPPAEWTLDADTLTTELEEANPELQRQAALVSAARNREELVRLTGYPDLVLGATYIEIGDPSINATAADAGDDAWSVTAAITLPLGRSRIKAQRGEARALAERATWDLDNRTIELHSALQVAIANHTDAQRRLQLFGGELVDLARQAVANSRTSYEAGRLGILDVIDSERSLLDLQLQQWRAAADVWQQRILIQTLTLTGLAPTALEHLTETP